MTIFARSVFRVAELKDGFNGDLANNEVAFMILEGVMIMVACGCLTVFHPGYCFGGKWQDTQWKPVNKNESELSLEGVGTGHGDA